MNTLGKSASLLLAVVAIVISGCGGSSPDGQAFQPRGEGNIPIGRAGNPDQGECRASFFLSNGSRFDTVSRNGIVYSDRLPNGATSVTLYPKDSDFNPQTIVFLAGPEQKYQFNARFIKRAAAVNVLKIICSIPDGTTLNVGETYDLKVLAFTRDLEIFKPTVALSKGFGQLDSQDRLIPTRAGTGQIILQAMGYTATINVQSVNHNSEH